MNKVADTDWYNAISETRSLGLRCPFTTGERCPRYYLSLSLLSKTGAPAIDPDVDARLLQKWEGTELWPKLGDHKTRVIHSGERLSQINNFCPEVTYDRYGLFCTDLGTYADEIDRDSAYKRLSSKGASRDHPNWYWSYSKEGHFSECPLYSVLSHSNPDDKNSEKSDSEPWWRQHLWQIIVGVVVGLAVTLFKWLLG